MTSTTAFALMPKPHSDSSPLKSSKGLSLKPSQIFQCQRCKVSPHIYQASSPLSKSEFSDNKSGPSFKPIDSKSLWFYPLWHCTAGPHNSFKGLTAADSLNGCWCASWSRKMYTKRLWRTFSCCPCGMNVWKLNIFCCFEPDEPDIWDLI